MNNQAQTMSGASPPKPTGFLEHVEDRLQQIATAAGCVHDVLSQTYDHIWGGGVIGEDKAKAETAPRSMVHRVARLLDLVEERLTAIGNQAVSLSQTI